MYFFLSQIPKSLVTVYQEMSNSKAEIRPNPADMIVRCRSNGGFFKNDLIDALLFLEEIQVKEKNEKGRFFSQLTNQLDCFPEGVGRYKILPQLIAAFEYGDAGSAVLPPLLQLGRVLPDNEYQKRVVPCVVKLFASNDRATRLRLLQQLDRFVNHLQPVTVNEAIFPQVRLFFYFFKFFCSFSVFSLKLLINYMSYFSDLWTTLFDRIIFNDRYSQRSPLFSSVITLFFYLLGMARYFLKEKKKNNNKKKNKEALASVLEAP